MARREVHPDDGVSVPVGMRGYLGNLRRRRGVDDVVANLLLFVPVSVPVSISVPARRGGHLGGIHLGGRAAHALHRFLRLQIPHDEPSVLASARDVRRRRRRRELVPVPDRPRRRPRRHPRGRAHPERAQHPRGHHVFPRVRVPAERDERGEETVRVVDVSSVGFLRLSRSRVRQPDASVEGTHQEISVVRRPPRVSDGRTRSLAEERAQTRASVDGPYPDESVVRRGEERGAVSGESNRDDGIGVRGEDVHARAVDDVPQANGLVARAAGEDVSRAGEVAGEDVRRVAAEDAQASTDRGGARVDVPQVQVLVVAGGGEVAPVRGPRAVRAALLVADEGQEERAVRHAPDLHQLVRRRGRQTGAVGGESNRGDRLVVARERARVLEPRGRGRIRGRVVTGRHADADGERAMGRADRAVTTADAVRVVKTRHTDPRESCEYFSHRQHGWTTTAYQY